MATSKPVLHPVPPAQPDASPAAYSRAARNQSALGACIASSLTMLAVVLHGYHPYAEDGGVYLAGIKHLLDPSLYPSHEGFITAHLRFSLFAPLVALLVRTSHLSLMTVMFLLYVGSVWLTLFAAWQVAIRCYHSMEACCGALSLLAVGLTVPIAGTSLMLMDPYVSARSISTPCALFALAGTIDIVRAIRRFTPVPWRSIALCAGSLCVAGILHPLMAAYALAFVLLLACASFHNSRTRLSASAALCACAILLALCVLHFAPAQTADYLRVAQTRTYWFLDRWQWYEQVGLAAPILILVAAGFGRRAGKRAIIASLAQAGVLAGVTATIIALLCAQVSLPTYIIAELQPLRIFQIVYIVMILAVGAFAGRQILKRHYLLWLGTFTILGGIAFFAQQLTFPDSAHLELPWTAPSNGWEQGFLWVRDHSPRNAVFALDAGYITSAGEDSHNFRAIAERSTLPDYSKDGGVASIAPRLTGDWIAGQRAQTHLDSATDVQRIARLRSSAAGWIILSRDTTTAFDCVYSNASMKVCRLPSVDRSGGSATAFNQPMLAPTRH